MVSFERSLLSNSLRRLHFVPVPFGNFQTTICPFYFTKFILFGWHRPICIALPVFGREKTILCSMSRITMALAQPIVFSGDSWSWYFFESVSFFYFFFVSKTQCSHTPCSKLPNNIFGHSSAHTMCCRCKRSLKQLWHMCAIEGISLQQTLCTCIVQHVHQFAIRCSTSV